jgi:hypothetical protein
MDLQEEMDEMEEWYQDIIRKKNAYIAELEDLVRTLEKNPDFDFSAVSVLTQSRNHGK